MSKSYIITGLDIGSSFIKTLTVLKKPGFSDLEVLSQKDFPSFGVRKGAVVDAEKASNNIRKAVEQLQEEAGQKIDSVYINIGGSHVYTTPSHSSVAVSRADQKVSQEDVERVMQGAQAISIPSNKEVLDILPRCFIVDGEEGIKDPQGMKGMRLEVESLLVCVFSPYLKNLTNAVLNAGVQVADIIPSPLASARAVLNPQQKELGVAVVDIGAGTTSMAVYEEGDLIHAAVFPFGSSNITSDIAIGLRTDLDTAEKIKRQFGSCSLKKTTRKEKIEVAQEPSSLVFSRKVLIEIIEARISEIFEQVNKELKKISRQELLPGGIILCGGGIKLPGLVDLVKKELKLPVQIGIPLIAPSSDSEEIFEEDLDEKQKFIGLKEDPALNTVCGLVLGGADVDDEPGISNFSKSIKEKLKRIFKIFIP